MPAQQFRYFLLTVPQHLYLPFLPPTCCYIRGQLEQGADTGYLHWQLLVHTRRKLTITGLKSTFGEQCHIEPSRSDAAAAYVWKEETRIAGTQFELGNPIINRNSSKDWEEIWNHAKSGEIEQIPADVRLRSYHTLKRIAKDYTTAPWRETVSVNCFWGKSGSGKSHRAFTEAAELGTFYIKSSTTKWWDGYKGETVVIIDEFRGAIAIEHLLKWFDKYPCFVEEKGGQLALRATIFYVCTNKEPALWYPGLDEETFGALLRRMTIVHFQ